MRRFGLRDLFWLVACVALALAWGLDHGVLVKELRQERSQHETTTRDLQSFLFANQILREDLEALKKGSQPSEAAESGPNFGGVKPKIIPQEAEPVLP